MLYCMTWYSRNFLKHVFLAWLHIIAVHHMKITGLPYSFYNMQGDIDHEKIKIASDEQEQV